MPEAELRRETASPGFTVIELMLALGLIGILAALGYGSFHAQLLKSRRAEAYSALDGIYKAQAAYHASADRYGDSFDVIGFQLDGGRRTDERTIRGRYYTMTVQALAADGVEGANFEAYATGDLDPGDAILDILVVRNNPGAAP